jgi:hypothetical protein
MTVRKAFAMAALTGIFIGSVLGVVFTKSQTEYADGFSVYTAFLGSSSN